MEHIERHPRPLGTTNLGRLYNNNPTKQNLNRLRQVILTYFNDHQLYVIREVQATIIKRPKKTKKKVKQVKPATRYQVSSATIEECSRLIGLRVSKVEQRLIKMMAKKATDMAETGQLQVIQDITRDCGFSIFFRALQRIQDQFDWQDELKQQSRAMYHAPGYAASANIAISQTNTYLAQVMKMAQQLNPSMIPNPTVNIQNNIGQMPAPNENTLTPDKAVQLLAEANTSYLPLDNRKEHFAHLKEAYLTDDIPNVTANHSDAQGVASAGKWDFTQQTKPITHANRREQEETGPITIDID